MLLWEINTLSRSPEAEGHYCQTNTHACTHTHSLTHPASCMTDFHLSLSLSLCLPLSLLPSVFLLPREEAGVNHYRQYRLKMQSPPGAQGHWRPMGGRKSAHVQMCTRSQPTGAAACKQSDSTASPLSFLFFSRFLILHPSVNLISSPC